MSDLVRRDRSCQAEARGRTRTRISGLTIEFVYVLGIASRNHKPRPLRNPTPSALTRSRTMRPSRRATPTLNTVRKTRKKECETRMRDSFECHEGNAIRIMAKSCRRKVLSRLGLCDVGTRGNRFALPSSAAGDVGLIGTCMWFEHAGRSARGRGAHLGYPPFVRNKEGL